MIRQISNYEVANLALNMHTLSAQRLEALNAYTSSSIDDLMNDPVARRIASITRAELQGSFDRDAMTLELASIACAREKIGSIIAPNTSVNNIVI